MTIHSSARSKDSVGLQAKVSFLSRPDSYPENPSDVETVRTHMSCVFLTDDHAYKLKRPVRFNFLDFSTLEARHRDCLEEVRLNRRLAPDVYLGVLPVVRTTRGGLQLDGDGEPVEWLVKMRRLPRVRMLDQVIQEGAVDDDDIRRCARVLADFYRHSPSVAMGTVAYRERFERDIRANRRALREPDHQVAHTAVERIAAAQLAALNTDAPIFDQRVREKRIVEGHGDLRPEHVCLGTPPRFIDCLEFNRAFRIVDPVDELSYLALECEFAGNPAIGKLLLDTYCEETGDRPPKRLIAFYKSCRATLRAKLSIWHLRDCGPQEFDRWTARAEGYLALADRYALPR